MKKTLFLFLLLPLSMQAQKDFNFKVFTSRLTAIKSYDGKSDTLHLSIFRNFEKTANVIKAVNPTNTADVTEYKVEYNGYSYAYKHLVYRVIKIDGENPPSAMTIYIDPILPRINVKTEHTSSIFD